MQVAVKSSHNSQRYEHFILPSWCPNKGEWSHYLRCLSAGEKHWLHSWDGQCHGEVASILMWGATVEIKLWPSLHFLGRASRTNVSSVGQSLCFFTTLISGNLGNTISALSGCKQPFDGQLCRSIQSFWSSCCHKSQKSYRASHDDLFRRSTGYISDTQTLSSLYFCFWFYFQLLISCMISISIATLTPVCSGAFPGANVTW